MFWCSENKRPTGRAAAAHARVQSGVRGARRQAHTQPRRGLSAPTRARVSSQRSAESLTALEAADLAGRRSLRRRPLPSPTNAPPPATLSALRPCQCPRCALPAPSSPAQGRSPGGRAPPWLRRGAGQPEGSTVAAAEQEVSVGEKEPLSGGRGTSGPAEARRPNWRARSPAPARARGLMDAAVSAAGPRVPSAFGSQAQPWGSSTVPGRRCSACAGSCRGQGASGPWASHSSQDLETPAVL